MEYLIVIIVGLISGSLVNIYLYPKEAGEPFLRRYTGFFYKHVKFIYPEILLAAVLGMLYKKYGFNVQFASYSILSMIVISAAVIDIKKRIIPDKLVIMGIAAGLFAVLFNKEISFPSSLLAMVTAGGILWGMNLITKGGVGLGDAKLFACVGVFIGFEKTLSSMLIATVLSGITGLVMIVISISNRHKSIPFAPFIMVGTLFTLFL